MRLEADGIPAFVADDQLVWMKWPLSTALGGVRVQVPNGCGAEAEASLARCASGECQTELVRIFGALDDLHCPHCGSANVRRRPSLSEIVSGLAILVLTGVAIKLGALRCTCRICRTRWIDTRYE